METHYIHSVWKISQIMERPIPFLKGGTLFEIDKWTYLNSNHWLQTCWDFSLLDQGFWVLKMYCLEEPWCKNIFMSSLNCLSEMSQAPVMSSQLEYKGGEYCTLFFLLSTVHQRKNVKKKILDFRVSFEIYCNLSKQSSMTIK